MKQIFQIAGVPISMEWDGDSTLEQLAGFRGDSAREPELQVRLHEKNGQWNHWYGLDYCRADLEFPHQFISHKFPRVRMKASRDWSRMVVDNCANAWEGVLEVLAAGFCSYLAFRGGVFLHASLVDHKGEGILFTADSGVGKTTQAQLWEKYMDGRILNGDKAVLRWDGDVCRAWGSPWKGSSPYQVNEQTPLRGIVVLSQAKENTIRRLNPQEALALFLPHAFYPSWDPESTGSLMKNLDRILREIPVWALSCRPDREAVELTYNTVWGENKG